MALLSTVVMYSLFRREIRTLDLASPDFSRKIAVKLESLPLVIETLDPFVIPLISKPLLSMRCFNKSI